MQMVSAVSSRLTQYNPSCPVPPLPVFSRCHGNAPLRLSQNHHVEDEVIHSSTFLSTGRHSPDSRYLIPSFSSLLASLAAGCIILWALACLCCACRLLLGRNEDKHPLSRDSFEAPAVMT